MVYVRGLQHRRKATTRLKQPKNIFSDKHNPTSRPLYPGAMNIYYPTDGGLHRRCEDKSLVPLPQIEPLLIGRQERSLFAVQTELSKLLKRLPKTLKNSQQPVNNCTYYGTFKAYKHLNYTQKFSSYLTENTFHEHYKDTPVVLFKEIIAAYFDTYTRRINTPCGRVQCLNAAVEGTSNKHFALIS